MNRVLALSLAVLFAMFALMSTGWVGDTTAVRLGGFALVLLLVLDVAWSWRHDKAARQVARR